MPERVSCPMCCADSAERVRTTDDIARCNKCGVVYLRTRPTVQEMEDYYQRYASNPGSHMSIPKTVDDIRNTGLRREYFLKEVIDHTRSSTGSMLDVGAGWGGFLIGARDAGFSVKGVEIGKDMAEFGTRILGIPIQSSQLEGCEFKDAEFDVVTLIHSLEHLPAQRHALGMIHRILKEDGFICGIVPNFDSFCSQHMQDGWPWLDANVHYVHLTPKSITELLYMHGFVVHRCYTATGDFDRKILAQQMMKKDPRMPRQMIDKHITNLENSGQGEEIRFYAQKI